MNSRRSFIKKLGGASLLAASAPMITAKLLASGELTKITLLHTNDWHSRMEPFPMDGSRYQGLGGAARRAALINKIRAVEPNVLLLDAGDIFQGTPYFNFFEGELEYKIMSEMKYDLATFGNHDFDLGLKGLENVWHHKNFDFVNCNYGLEETFLHDKAKRYKIFEKGGIRIGITGIGIDLIDKLPPVNHAGIVYNDPIKPVNAIAATLKNELKCDLVICLSHLGYEYKFNKVSDIDVAEQSEHIDVIIGGHTHTFMDAPDIRKNRLDKPVYIHQVGWAGILLGRIDLYFDLENKSKKQLVASALPVGNLA